ncbi:MAG: PQQ-binding-like beta-propeller repeat protein [Steroidobacteraceae bacterium]|nr:PQQ-binding-like beta-propeller repeat protein [Steroidobacteraceae bacterium]
MLAALTLAAGAALAEKLQHGPITDPDIVATVDAKVLRIGHLTHAAENGGVFYVAGEEGVAAISADGKPQWAARLPRADVRLIAVDGSGVAFVAQTVTGGEPGAAARFIKGDLAEVPEFQGAVVGLLDKGRRGAVLWTAQLETEYRVAPPGIAGATIAVSDGVTLALFDRIAGAQVSRAKTFPGFLAGHWIFKGATRNAPVFANDSYYVAFTSELSRVDAATGKENWRKSHHGLMSPFNNITAGPVVWGDRIAFGNSINSRGSGINNITRIFVGDTDGEQVWNDRHDQDSGIASLAVRGDRLFAASNFRLSAYEVKGKKVRELWSNDTAARDGALTFSQLRGVRFYQRSKGAQVAEAALLAILGGSDSDDIATRIAYGNCLAADDQYVYLSSSARGEYRINKALLMLGNVDRQARNVGGAELITVVDAGTGRLVASIDAKGLIFDLLLLGPNIATYDAETIRIFRRPT